MLSSSWRVSLERSALSHGKGASPAPGFLGAPSQKKGEAADLIQDASPSGRGRERLFRAVLRWLSGCLSPGLPVCRKTGQHLGILQILCHGTVRGDHKSVFFWPRKDTVGSPGFQSRASCNPYTVRSTERSRRRGEPGGRAPAILSGRL